MPRPSRGLSSAGVVALATALVAAAFALQGRIGLNLADEGYLWYGALAVLRGEVPFRDFQSYDPGRYYWTAAWLGLLGPGVVPLRIACAAFELPGLVCGLLVLRRLTASPWRLAVGGAVLLLWATPQFMLNHALALVAVWCAVRQLERPTLARHVASGVCVGVAAFVGRNLGLYELLSFAALVVLVGWEDDAPPLPRRCAAWAAGIAVGYAPMLAMFVAVPGFWQANVDATMSLVRFGATNVAKPVPWPWTAASAWGAGLGAFFLLLPSTYVVALAWRVVARDRADDARRVAVAAALVGVPYMHYAFSRADVEHLAMAIHPMLLAVAGLLAALASRRRAAALALATLVTAGSVGVAGAVSPFWEWATAPAGEWTTATIGTSTLRLHAWDADLIREMQRFTGAELRPDEGFLVLSHVGPGMYSILGRRSPVWEIYFVLPLPETYQRRMIDELERNRVRWIFYEDAGTDRRDDLRLPNSHPLLWAHIVERFEAFPIEGLDRRYLLLRRRAATPG